MSRDEAPSRSLTPPSRDPVRPRVRFIECDFGVADLSAPGPLRKGHRMACAYGHCQAMEPTQSAHANPVVVNVFSFGSKGYNPSDTMPARLLDTPGILPVVGDHQIAGGAAELFIALPLTLRQSLPFMRAAHGHVALATAGFRCSSGWRASNSVT